MISFSNRSIGDYFVVVFAVAIALATLFTSVENGGETWGFWLFAEIFADTGDFVIFGRSPLYVFYLTPFAWLGFPQGLILEYVLSMSLALVALVLFFRPHVGIWIALAGIALWVPFLQTIEPAGQRLTLAIILYAVILRRGGASPTRISISYTILLAAILVRTSYLVIPLVFLSWDALYWIRNGSQRPNLSIYLKARIIVPVALVVLFSIFVAFNQSAHRWNNAWFATTEYYPTDGKSISSAAFLFNFNQQYVNNIDAMERDTDFYFTNDELFDGADTTVGAIIANPKFVSEQVIRYVKTLAEVTTYDLTVLDSRTVTNIRGRLPAIVPLVMAISFSGLLVFGAYKQSSGPVEKVAVAGFLLVALGTLLYRPIARYMVLMIPVYLLAAAWYGSVGTRFLNRFLADDQRLFVGVAAGMGVLSVASGAWVVVDIYSDAIHARHLMVGAFALALAIGFISAFAGPVSGSHRWTASLGKITVLLALALMSTGVLQWGVSGSNFLQEARGGEFSVMKNHIVDDNTFSLRAAHGDLESALEGCQGLMTEFPLLVGAFTDFPVDRIYDIWEVPPFGQLGDGGIYDGLNIERVDCVLLKPVVLSVPNLSVNNNQVRLDNYLIPYVELLEDEGGATVMVPNIGPLTKAQ